MLAQIWLKVVRTFPESIRKHCSSGIAINKRGPAGPSTQSKGSQYEEVGYMRNNEKRVNVTGGVPKGFYGVLL